MRKHQNDDNTWDSAGRIKSLEMFSGSLVARPEHEAEVIPILRGAPSLIPQPRRSRVFLRSGGGHGVFAELTVTAPRPRASLD